MKMEDKTNEFEEIIKSGSIDKIIEFQLINFHKIKHTVSFGLLIERLKKIEEKLQKIKRIIE